jgi:hypothetical protein
MESDVKGSLRFDLPQGTVELRGEPAVVVPAVALETLLRAAPAGARADMGRDVGRVVGARVADRLGGASGVRAASIEDVTTALATEVSLLGLGVVATERWGRALVFSVSGGGLPAQKELVAGILEGAVSAATGTQAACISLPEGRYFVGNARACDRLRNMLAGGATWGEAIGRLQVGGAS